ncbi:MAG: TonB-dependent receptor [Gemmatimonadota bacterium]|nr:TonB-dependent receptor [Gemmatimonadota bacterium]
MFSSTKYLCALILSLAVAIPLAAQQAPARDRAALRTNCHDSLQTRGDTASSAMARCMARLKEVTVVATPANRAEPLSAVSVPISVIERTFAQDTWDLLRQAAGVEIHLQGQGPGFASDASVRGFSSDHSTDLALWIDGVPVNEPANGHAEGYNDFSVLFPQAVRDIDVIKGPTSALFGNFALAGVVNVRTLERMTGTRAEFSGGSFGHTDGAVLSGFDHGARGGGVFGIRGEHESGWRPNSGYDVAQAHARVLHDLTSAAAIDAGAELHGARWNSPGYLSETEFASRQFDIVSNSTDRGFKRRAQERVSLRVLTGSTLWRTTLYSTQSRWQLYLTIPPEGGVFEGSGSQTEEEDSRYGFGLTSAATWAFPGVELTTGVEGRWDQARYENWFTTNRVRDSSAALVTARQLSGAAFLQGKADVGAQLTLTAGARLEQLGTRAAADGATSLSGTHGVFSPKVGALYRVGGGVAAYTNLSRGYRQTDGVILDPSLGFVTAWAYEGGIKIDRGGTSLSAALFRMDVDNEQSFNPLTRGSTSGGASRRQGLELEAHATLPGDASLSTSWTFNDARYTRRVDSSEDPDGDPVVLSGQRVYNTAKYIGAAALEVAPIAAVWNVRVAGSWIGPYSPFDEPGVVLPGYALAYASAGMRVGVASLDVGVRNAFDRAYPEVVASHVVAPGQPRSLYARIRYSF